MGTCVGQPTFRRGMDEKTLNLWRQIEGYRRINKAPGAGRSKLPAAPPRPSISE